MIFFGASKKRAARQIGEFVDWKRERAGTPVAVEHKERLMLFLDTIRPASVQSISIDDVWNYKYFLLDRFHGEYLSGAHMHSVRCLLRFYRRYDILAQMTRLGRKPDYMAIAKVKEWRSQKPPLSYSKIIARFKEEGRRIDVKQVHRWVYSKMA